VSVHSLLSFDPSAFPWLLPLFSNPAMPVHLIATAAAAVR
jgi:hypothetical protein